MSPEQPKGRSLPGGREALELWGGLALVAIGFVAVAIGWVRAAGTVDVRVQLQLLISGGLGGLGLVVAGAFLVQAYLTTSGFRRLEHQLDRVTSALLELAGTASAFRPDEAVPQGQAPSDGSEATDTAPGGWVLASHAAYHVPGCDLLEGREDVRPMTLEEAGAERLAPCRVCVKEPVG